MITKYLSVIWAAAPALGNHLWQSTLFAIVAGLLTVVLRKNQARASYWLWLAASVKFLIRFSLLVGVGSHLAWSHATAPAKAGAYFAMEEVSQPFTQHAVLAISRTAPSAGLPNLIHLLPAVLAAVWLCGFAAVLFVWCVRWRRISATAREAVPLWKGREVEALRRLERTVGNQNQTEMLVSRASLEPGIFGIVRPVLLWPEGISERLDNAHLEAILAHELRHVRRHDNLVAAIHMTVEAIFWFFPLVWWIGARLIEERERACDEEVLEMGSEPQIYAESILKTCEFCVRSPLDCVSGVTGADLKQRIVRIMTEGVARKLDFRRKLLLIAAGLIAVAVPIAFGQGSATQGTAPAPAASTAVAAPALVFDVASIKPDKSSDGMSRIGLLPGSNFVATNVLPLMLIRMAYGIEDNQISGAPSWLSSQRYDIDAKPNEFEADQLQKLSPQDRSAAVGQMIQALLADRFKLTLHHETKELPEYVLVIAKNGPKMQEAKPDDTYPNGFDGPNGRPGTGMMRMTPGQVTGQGVALANLVRALSAQLGSTVIDKTGLTGKYDFTLRWTPDVSQASTTGAAGAAQQGPGAAPAPDSSGPSIFTAIEEQLGLKLESQKGPVDILVIDHAEEPSEN